MIAIRKFSTYLSIVVEGLRAGHPPHGPAHRPRCNALYHNQIQGVIKHETVISST